MADKLSPVDEQKYRFLIGEDVVTKEKVFLYPEKFNLGGYIIGTRGSGKSKLLTTLLAQSMKFNRGLCIIDPHADLIYEATNRLPKHRIDQGEVIYLDPLDEDGAWPFGLNIFHCENKNSLRAVERTVSLVTHLFKKLWPSESAQPLVDDVLLQVTRTIIANELTMTEVVPLLTNDRFRERLLKNVTNPDTLSFWETYNTPKSLEREQGGSTIARRVRQFTSNEIIRHIVGQDKPKLNLRDVMDKNRILLVKLYSEDEPLTSLIGSTIIGQFLQAALTRSDLERSQRAPFDLYCDEFRNFATDDFAKIIDECRKYGLNPYVSHQTQNQISESNQDSVIQLGSFYCFKVIGKDAKNLSLEFNADPTGTIRTIPRNVLRHLSSHQHEAVKEFWARYVDPLDQALTKHERYENESYMALSGETVRRTETIYPDFDFGAGVRVAYDLDQVRKARTALNNLLYEIMRRRSSQETLLLQVIRAMAKLLDFVDYYNFFYGGDSSFFTPSRYRENIAEYERMKTLLSSFLSSETDMMRYFAARTSECKLGSRESLLLLHNPFYYLFTNYETKKKAFFIPDRFEKPEALADLLNKYKQKPIHEIEQLFQNKLSEFEIHAEHYSSAHAYLAYLLDVYRQKFALSTSIWIFGDYTHFNPYENRKDFNSLYSLDYKKYPTLPGWDTWLFSKKPIIEAVRQEKLREWKFSTSNYEDLRFQFACTYAEAKTGLKNEENFVKLLSATSHDNFGWHYEKGIKSPEEIQKRLTEECAEIYAICEPRNTQQKLLARTRQDLETELAELEAKLQSLMRQRDREIEERQQALDRHKKREKAHHDEFQESLRDVLEILKQPNYTIEVQGNKPVAEQNYADRRNQIANELAHLPPRRMRVKLPTGEYTLKTVDDSTDTKDQGGKRTQVIAYTRQHFCTPRNVVEEQIRGRIKNDSVTPTTKRTHTL